MSDVNVKCHLDWAANRFCGFVNLASLQIRVSDSGQGSLTARNYEYERPVRVRPTYETFLLAAFNGMDLDLQMLHKHVGLYAAEN